MLTNCRKRNWIQLFRRNGYMWIFDGTFSLARLISVMNISNLTDGPFSHGIHKSSWKRYRYRVQPRAVAEQLYMIEISSAVISNFPSCWIRVDDLLSLDLPRLYDKVDTCWGKFCYVLVVRPTSHWNTAACSIRLPYSNCKLPFEDECFIRDTFLKRRDHRML